MSNLPCIYCLTNPTGSREHIILSMLGGSRASTEIICSKCNNSFSHAPDGIDNAVARLFGPLCTQLWIFSDRGQPPATIRNIRGDDGHLYDLHPGGIQTTSSQKYAEDAASAPPGQKKFSLTLPSFSKINRRLPHLQEQHGEKLASLTVSEIFDPTLVIELGFVIDNTRVYRGLMKSLVNWLGVIAPAVARTSQLAPARDYILNDNEDWERLNINYAIPWPDEVPFQVPVHALLIDSRSQPGQLIGLVQLFGVLRYSTVISSNYEGDPIASALVVDPWTKRSTVLTDFEPIHAPVDMSDQLQRGWEQNLGKFDELMRHIQAVAKFVGTRTQIMYGILRGFQQAKIKPRDIRENPEAVKGIVEQVTHRLMGLPLTKQVSIDGLQEQVVQEEELEKQLEEWARKMPWREELAKAQARRNDADQ